MRLSQILQGGFEECEEPINGSDATWGKTVNDSCNKDPRMQLPPGMSQLRGSEYRVNDWLLTGQVRGWRSIRG